MAFEEDERQRCIFVRNLSHASTQESVTRYFESKVGKNKLERVNVVSATKNGKPNCFAFVTFKTINDTQKVLERTAHRIDGRTTFISVAELGRRQKVLGGDSDDETQPSPEGSADADSEGKGDGEAAAVPEKEHVVRDWMSYINHYRVVHPFLQAPIGPSNPYGSVCFFQPQPQPQPQQQTQQSVGGAPGDQQLLMQLQTSGAPQPQVQAQVLQPVPQQVAQQQVQMQMGQQQYGVPVMMMAPGQGGPWSQGAPMHPGYAAPALPMQMQPMPPPQVQMPQQQQATQGAPPTV
eukprot:m.359098 g.359098  ORF g.359098 m.359098 type:complete len:292 (-) comp18412_c0_seq1:210-1085(-)